MKKGLLILVTAVSATILVLSAWGCGTSSTGGGSETGSPLINQQSTGIWVTGVGKVTVIPDVAIVSMGVQAQASTVAGAQQQAASSMTAVMSALKTNGVADKDIATLGYSIIPVYSYNPTTGKQTLEGYSVTNTVNVKIRNVGNAGVVIDAAAVAGGDNTIVNSVTLTVDQPEQYNDAARTAAVADAANRAKQLANLSGVKLGKATYINETLTNTPQTISFDTSGKVAPSVTTPISPGETEITLTIQIIYSIS
jgi:hypothetical protein